MASETQDTERDQPESFQARCVCAWAGPTRGSGSAARADGDQHAHETGHEFDFQPRMARISLPGAPSIKVEKRGGHSCVEETGVECPDSALSMTAEQVRARYPRKICPKCGAITYASFRHYIAGDW